MTTASPVLRAIARIAVLAGYFGTKANKGSATRGKRRGRAFKPSYA